MSKKKISRRRELRFEDIPSLKFNETQLSKLKTFDSEAFFKDQNKVGAALFQCLLENDTEAFIEILDEYLKVNRSRVAKNASLARSTVQDVFSKRGNPTLKTIAKIVHHEAHLLDPVIHNTSRIAKSR